MSRLAIIGSLFVLFYSCTPDGENMTEGDLSEYTYQPEPYELVIPEEFPDMTIPEDNPLTIAGVELGRHLFHDKLLSVDNTIACADCHLKNQIFSDPNKFSIGVDGALGKRQAMSIINSGFFENGLFWDGRAETLEELSLLPVEDPVEQAHDWSAIEEILRDHETYPKRFAEAFDIDDREEITRFLAVKALAQYQRALISSADSKYDRFLRNEAVLTDLELDGFQMYFDAQGPFGTDAQCFHCHSGPFLTNNQYMNNGLDSADQDLIFDDLGRFNVTGVHSDRGKFRVPTLRNIEYTAPYMHDGRFSTLEEVIDHYSGGGHFAPNIDPNVQEQSIKEFTQYEKDAILAFMKTFSDTSFLSKEIFQDPFE